MLDLLHRVGFGGFVAQNGEAAPEVARPTLEDAEALEQESRGDGHIDVAQVKQQAARDHGPGGHAVQEEHALIDDRGVEAKPAQIGQHEQAHPQGPGQVPGVRGHADVRALAGHEAGREIDHVQEGKAAQLLGGGEPVAEQEIGKQLLLETAAYAETSVCRRKVLLHYFGEEYLEDNCGNCDNCLNPKKQVEAKELLSAVLEVISTLKEKFKADYIVNILVGNETSEIQNYKHNELEVFGSGQDEDDKTWNAVIRQALIAGYLAKDIENYGLLKITEKGKEFMKKPVSFKITEDNEFEEEEEEVPVRGGASCAVDPVLYSMMKDLRKKLSKRLEVPPFVIFQDPSLEAMATTYPITLDELQNIPGVGAGKAKRYGKEFIELIKKHVEENEIERPEDLRVRTVANKSKLKVSIIQRIDRKVALDEIALTNGLEFTELLDEIEAIVYSGTRINIDYFLNDVMDEDHIEDIYEYFKDSETDGLEDAIEELGGDYTEEEIRLVRIKFLSEMAN